MGFLDVLAIIAGTVMDGLESKTRQMPEYKSAYNEGSRLSAEELCKRIYRGESAPANLAYHDILKNKSIREHEAKKLSQKYECSFVTDALKDKF